MSWVVNKVNKSKVISLWSKAGHQNGITTSSIAFAVKISNLLPEKNILVLDTNTQFAFLQDYLGVKHNNKTLDTLIDRENTNELTKEGFCDCLNVVEEQPNIYSVNANQNHIYNNVREMKESFNNILSMAKDIFEIIIIDNSAGQSELSKLANNRADLIVNFMKLNKHLLDYMKEANQIVEIMDKNKYLNIFNMYREEIGINRSAITKTWDMENFDIIPFYEDLDYQLNSNNFIKYLNSNSSDDYTKAINNIVEKIMIILDIKIENTEENEVKDRKRGFFGLFL